MSNRDYCYPPEYTVLRNRLDIRDAQALEAAEYFRGSGPDGFAEGAGPVLGDVNHVHPFREGNGRTQLQYLKQLAARAVHAIELTRIDSAAWLDA